jgi:hypothetical protein
MKKRTLNKLKWMIIWTIIYTVGLYLMDLFLKNLNYDIWYIFITGFGVTVVMKIFRSFIRNEELSLDRGFLFWGVINSFFIWAIWLGLSRSNFEMAHYARLLWAGFGLVLVRKLIVNTRELYRHKKLFAAILIFILFYFNWGDVSQDLENRGVDMDSIEKGEKLDLSIGVDESEVENKILKLVNEERASNGRGSLAERSDLKSMAVGHSRRMLNEGFFEHSNYNVGENIGMTPRHYMVVGCGPVLTENQIANCLVASWIESPGHHMNMIDSSYSVTGIGVSCDLTECLATQTFQ